MNRAYETAFLKQAGTEFASKYRVLVRQLKADYVGVPVPEPGLSNLSNELGGARMYHDIVIVGSDLLERLNPDELLAVVAHEFGHYYANHKREPIRSFAEQMEVRHRHECQADHFAARYVDPKHLVSALHKIHGGKWHAWANDVMAWGLEWQGYYQEHPRNWNRETLLNDVEMLRARRAEDVKYGMECEVLEVKVPTVPKQLPAIGQRR